MNKSAEFAASTVDAAKRRLSSLVTLASLGGKCVRGDDSGPPPLSGGPNQPTSQNNQDCLLWLQQYATSRVINVTN